MAHVDERSQRFFPLKNYQKGKNINEITSKLLRSDWSLFHFFLNNVTAHTMTKVKPVLGRDSKSHLMCLFWVLEFTLY